MVVHYAVLNNDYKWFNDGINTIERLPIRSV